MDATTLNTIVGIVGAIVGIIGIIVGVIGWQSLNAANVTNNKTKTGKGSIVSQGNSYHYGVSEDTVRLIAQDLTKEQLCQLIIRLIPVNTDDENCIALRFRQNRVTAEDFNMLIDEIPTLFYGKRNPDEILPSKTASVWYQPD